MVQKLEDIKGGGGSIRVGTTGTISSLITREMQSRNHAPQTPASSSKKPPATTSASVPSGVTTSTTSSLPRRTSNEASSSSSSTNRINQRNHETTPRARQNTRKSTHTLPMLGSDDIALQRTPTRTNSNKKITHIVEVVDVKCGNTGKPVKAWSTPISSRLKKLGFSKLSVTMGASLRVRVWHQYGLKLHFEPPESSPRYQMKKKPASHMYERIHGVYFT